MAECITIRRRHVFRGRSASMSSTPQRRSLRIRPPAAAGDSPCGVQAFPYISRLRELSLQYKASHGAMVHTFDGAKPVTTLPACSEVEFEGSTEESLPLYNLRDVLNLALQDLESRISRMDALRTGLTADIMEEGAAVIRDGTDFFAWLKSEVGAKMPEFDIDWDHLDLSVAGLRSRLPELPNVRSKLPDFDFDVKGRFDRVSASFEDARTCLPHLDLSLPTLPDPQVYLPALREKLSTIRTQLSDLSLPSSSALPLASFSPPTILTELFPDVLGEAEADEPEDDQVYMDEFAQEIALANKASANGKKLINYEDLPTKWRNNEYIRQGYRFMPPTLQSIITSTFSLHNETMNIHTHLIPLLFLVPLTTPFLSWNNIFGLPSSASSSLPAFGSSLGTWFTSSEAVAQVDTFPRYMFFIAAAACLACSTMWHVCAGSSDFSVLQRGARIDYVGIGWLISASVATVVHYGLTCHPIWRMAYTALTVGTGLAGTVVPFQAWFDERKHKSKRVAFFLVLAGCSVMPITHMSLLMGARVGLYYLGTIIPSILAYLIGLMFYVSHFPECYFPGKLDFCGGSHAIWHLFIVLAIRLHWYGVEVFQSRANAVASCPMSS